MSENKLCVIDCRPEVCNSNVICTFLVVLCHTRCKKTKYYARKTSFDIKNDVKNYAVKTLHRVVLRIFSTSKFQTTDPGKIAIAH